MPRLLVWMTVESLPVQPGHFHVVSCRQMLEPRSIVVIPFDLQVLSPSVPILKKKQWSRYGGVDRLYFLECIPSRVNSILFLESPRGADAPSHWRQSWPWGEAVRYGGCFPTVGSKEKGRFGVQSQQSCIYWLGSIWRGMSYIIVWVIFLPSEIELNT